MQMFKEGGDQMLARMPMVRRARLMTDLSGRFFTVVLELEFETLADWEEYRREAFGNPDTQQAMGDTMSVIESGHGELYTLEWSASA